MPGKELKFLSMLLTCLLVISKATSEALKAKLESTLSNLKSNAFQATQPSGSVEQDHTIAVRGTASKGVESNLIKLRVKIESKDKLVNLAYINNTVVSSKVIKSISDMKIPEKNITTVNYQIYPLYRSEFAKDTSTWNQVFDGYQVTNTLQIEMSNVKKVSELISKITSSNNVSIESINFDFSPDLQQKIKDSLLDQAAEDAKNKALILANKYNVDIVDVKSISFNDYSPPVGYPLPYRYDMITPAAAVAASPVMAPPQIFAGTSNVSIDISVLFIIKKSKSESIK